MPPISLKDIARIIEHESKDATYKFALIRGTIDLIQEYNHYKSVSEAGVSFPMGLMILKWINYYYPILAHDQFIPQKYGDNHERTIAFRREFEKVIGLYPTTRSSDQLLHDLKRGITDEARITTILTAVKKIRQTIINQPMHFIGSAIGLGGSIYNYNRDGKRYRGISILDIQWFINHMGTFTIPTEMYHVLQVVGSFVTGTQSLIFQWAEFTSKLSKESRITTSEMISLLKNDFDERDVQQARSYYSNILEKGTLYCVWSGRRLRSDMDIDHMIPFVALRNNDLWNLLPSDKGINRKKSDRIPSADLLESGNVKDRIMSYWDQVYRNFPRQFSSEVQVSLLGNRLFAADSWIQDSYSQLIMTSNHLIGDRGFLPWTDITQK